MLLALERSWPTHNKSMTKRSVVARCVLLMKSVAATLILCETPIHVMLKLTPCAPPHGGRRSRCGRWAAGPILWSSILCILDTLVRLVVSYRILAISFSC